MTETDAPEENASSSLQAQLDERKIARGLAIGLPLVTGTMAMASGVLISAPMAILVLAAGVLLGVIVLLWASLRVLSGDAELPPEIAALDASAYGIDELASRKKMLVRALKDLDNERDLGKLDEEDHAEVSATYRSELKEVLRRMDESLEPYRAKAADAALAHLQSAGLAETGYRGNIRASEGAPSGQETKEAPAAAPSAPASAKASPATSSSDGRVACAKCGASNERDAKFCKGCGAGISSAKGAVAKEDSDDDA